jgi:hypothetical protein
MSGRVWGLPCRGRRRKGRGEGRDRCLGGVLKDTEFTAEALCTSVMKEETSEESLTVRLYKTVKGEMRSGREGGERRLTGVLEMERGRQSGSGGGGGGGGRGAPPPGPPPAPPPPPPPPAPILPSHTHAQYRSRRGQCRRRA